MTRAGVTSRLSHAIAEARPRITVVGDAILDVWLFGEAPAPILSRCSRVDVASHGVIAGALRFACPSERKSG